MNKFLYAVALSFVINLIVVLPTNASDESASTAHVKIISPSRGAELDLNHLSNKFLVRGISSNEHPGNCKVYLSINNEAPRLVTPGPSINSNYSSWYLYSSPSVPPLTIGENVLTARYVCHDYPSSNAQHSIMILMTGGTPAGSTVPGGGGLPSTGGERLESAN